MNFDKLTNKQLATLEYKLNDACLVAISSHEVWKTLSKIRTQVSQEIIRRGEPMRLPENIEIVNNQVYCRYHDMFCVPSNGFYVCPMGETVKVTEESLNASLRR